MHRAILAALALIVATLVVARGCASKPQYEPADRGLNMLSGDWVLKELGGVDVSSMLAPGARAPTLTIGKDASVSGFSGVNRFTSTVDPNELDKGGFNLSPVASTRMAGTPEAMELESKFLRDLTAATHFRIDSGNLHLTRGGDTLLKFARGS